MQTIKTAQVDFYNTKLAFSDQSNNALYEAYQLFKIMNNKRLVEIGEKLVNIAFAIKLPIKPIIRNTIYKHFVGGTSITDCGKTIERLAKRNVGSILDYALEGEESEELFEATCREIIRTIEYANKSKNVPFSAFKITGIASLDLLTKVCSNSPLTVNESKRFRAVEDRVEAIFKRGYELGVPVLIDSEQTWIQPILDDIVLKEMVKFNKEKAIVQNTYQMYRHDALERLKKHHRLSIENGFKFGLKIVRGAYMETERERANELGYPSPIQPNKAATDRDFDDSIIYMIENHNTIDFMVATHNEHSSMLLTQLIDENGIDRNYPGIYFSQLYGMSDHITYNLAENGYNVVKYLPYGEIKTMMPYLFRRARENSSIKGQTSRELQLIKSERNRRKKEKQGSK
ncbi:MAG: proline dehydrogenase family protein [Fermentimonas sp.]|nr:proline dehydrogenase family protein [Fermentimonas sp.]